MGAGTATHNSRASVPAPTYHARRVLRTRHRLAIARILSAAVRGARRLVGLGPRTIARRRGVRWDLDLREGIDLAVYLGLYERSILRGYDRRLEAGSVAIDIGANFGAHTLEMARRVGPDGLVFAFEPTDYAFGCLQRNLELNPALARRVRAAQMFLCSDAASPPTEVFASWPVAGNRDELHHDHGGRAVPTSNARALRLDDWVQTAQPGRIDLIKLDVDGYEIDVLRGSAQTLRRFRPVILMEYAPYLLSEFGVEVDDVLGFLGELEYRVTVPGSGREIRRDEWMRDRRRQGFCRVVLLLPSG